MSLANVFCAALVQVLSRWMRRRKTREARKRAGQPRKAGTRRFRRSTEALAAPKGENEEEESMDAYTVRWLARVRGTSDVPAALAWRPSSRPQPAAQPAEREAEPAAAPSPILPKGVPGELPPRTAVREVPRVPSGMREWPISWPPCTEPTCSASAVGDGPTEFLDRGRRPGCLGGDVVAGGVAGTSQMAFYLRVGLPRRGIVLERAVHVAEGAVDSPAAGAAGRLKAPVVARSPDRARLGSDRRRGDLRSPGWHGQETVPQRACGLEAAGRPSRRRSCGRPVVDDVVDGRGTGAAGQRPCRRGR